MILNDDVFLLILAVSVVVGTLYWVFKTRAAEVARNHLDERRASRPRLNGRPTGCRDCYYREDYELCSFFQSEYICRKEN